MWKDLGDAVSLFMFEAGSHRGSVPAGGDGAEPRGRL